MKQPWFSFSLVIVVEYDLLTLYVKMNIEEMIAYQPKNVLLRVRAKYI